jgi:hypothetical protein
VQPRREETPVAGEQKPPVAQENGSALVQRALRSPASLTPAAVKSLHHATGSRAAQTLLSTRHAPHSASFALQTKLEVGPAGDQYEQEADRIASSLMRHIHTQATVQRAKTPLTPEEGRAQREAEAAVEEVRLSGEGGTGLADGPVDGGTEQSIQKARDGGHALEPKVRGSMESAFRAEFGSVRVHTDSQADTLNRSLNARAFTTGSDLFFKRGAYNPGSSDGQKLIAHELTHVVQQGGSSAKRKTLQRAPHKNVIQRQLKFDQSWQPSVWSGWSGYDQQTAQDELNGPFRALEASIKALKSSKPRFIDKENNKKLQAVEDFIEEMKGREISFSEKQEVLQKIAGQRQVVKNLKTAPRELPSMKWLKPSLHPSLITPHYDPEESPMLSMPSIYEDFEFPSSRRMQSSQDRLLSLLKTPSPFEMGLSGSLGRKDLEGSYMLPKIKGESGLDESTPKPKEEENEARKAMPDNVKQANGKWIISFPNISGHSVISAEIVDFKISVEEKSQLKLINPQIHMPLTPDGERVEPIGIPLAIHATFAKDEGLAADIHLTTPQKNRRAFHCAAVDRPL